jgi:hypothetical protein
VPTATKRWHPITTKAYIASTNSFWKRFPAIAQPHSHDHTAGSQRPLHLIVAGMSELLARTLGDEIRVETALASGLWGAFVDASQLESSILNLAVNGRDAMPRGGKLTVETANAYLAPPTPQRTSAPGGANMCSFPSPIRARA